MMTLEEYNFKLARYLLNFSETGGVPEIDANEYKISSYLYNDQQLIAEINEILHKIKPYQRPALAGFHSYVHQHAAAAHAEREEKHDLLEHHHVHDTELLSTLIEFLYITIGLLVKLERMHKKHILCGNINPYTFMYNKKRRACEPVDLGVVLSDKNKVRAEKQPFGDYIYLLADLPAISYNRYLAPELRESIRVYHLQRRLRELGSEAEKRGIAKEQIHEIAIVLHDFHQKKVKYSNRAEIYSVGYTINQILSHSLSKLAHFGLRMNEFPAPPIDPAIIHEAELLLPDSFANPLDERIPGLVNEAIEYTYDLMKLHMEQRDTLQLSIEKFTSLLKRSSLTKPDTILEEEEEELEEVEEFLRGLEEEGEEEEHEEHEHEEHEHEEHEEHEHEK
ncbi:MAG TPA: hypothetical protein VLG38_04340, partial [Gammaproteobacteria bacterium]|nr:hypothetical protein [Gammaproteobacteria bacterium]